MRVYKLTDASNKTYGGCQWGEGVTHETSGEGDLCGKGWLHFYSHPLLAVALNPIHANFDPASMRLWEAEAEGEFRGDHGLKGGCTKLTTLRQIPVPEITTEQRGRFAILCAKAATKPGFCPALDKWADNWLNGTDRSAEAAWSAAEAAAEAAAAARSARSARSARAARAAAEAAARSAAINLVDLLEQASHADQGQGT